MVKSLPFVNAKNAYQNIFSSFSPLLPSRNIFLDLSLERKNTNSPVKLKLYEVRSDQQEENSENNEEEKEEEEYEKEYKEKLKIETLTKDMEEWLCIDKENILSNSELMTNAFKKIENFEIFLMFILNPMKKILEPCVK